MIRLLIVSQGMTGLQYHRQIVPHHYLSDMDEFRCDVVPNLVNQPDSFLIQFQAVVFLRRINENGHGHIIIAQLKRLGIKIIFDIDDFWELPPTHHLHQLYRNQKIKEETIRDIQAADLVTTTTEYFAAELRKHNNNVVVLPNCLDDNNPQWQPAPIESSLVRFGWIGGVYHDRDLRLMQESIKKVYERGTGFQFIIGGYQKNEFYQKAEEVFTNGYDLPEDYKEYLKREIQIADHFSYFQKYRRLWGTTVFDYGKMYNEIDVALVPLERNRFTSFKSEIKLVEAGTHGKAAIVSRVKPYDIFPKETVHYVEDGKPNEWYKAFRKMLLEPEYRKEKAERLKEYVKENYNLSKWNEVRKQVYKKLVNG